MAFKVMMSTKAMEVPRVETAPVFEIGDDKKGEMVGDLTVSQGGVRWRARYEREAQFFSWEEFAELMKAAAAKK